MYKSHPRQQRLLPWDLICMSSPYLSWVTSASIYHVLVHRTCTHVPAVDLEGDLGLVEFAWAWECDLGLAVSAVTWKWILCVCISYATCTCTLVHLPSIELDGDLGRAESTGVQCHIFVCICMLTNYMYTDSMQVKVKQSEMVWISKTWCDYAKIDDK